MAAPRIVYVDYQINDQPVRQLVREWQAVADNTDEAQQEARELGQEYERQRGIVEKLREKEKQLTAERDRSNDPKRIKAINREIANTQAALGHATGASRGLASSISALVPVLTTVAAAAAAISFGKKAIDAAVQYEQLGVSFEVFLGSAKEATKVLKQLDKFSLRTPFTPTQVQDAGKALLAFGIPVEKLESSLQMIGDTAAATGKDFNELALIYGKARTAGVVMAEDINQFTEAGIPIIDELAKVMGVTASEVKKLGSTGAITFPKLEQAFSNMTGEGGRFSGLMDKLADTTGGKISTLQGHFQALARTVGNALLPAVNSVVGALANLISGATDSRTESQRLFDEYQQGNEVFDKTQTELNGLVLEYEVLTGKASLNEKEQGKLRTVIDDLRKLVPEAVTEFDAYGVALGINTDAVRVNIAVQKEAQRLRSAEALAAIGEEVSDLTELYVRLAEAQRKERIAFVANDLAEQSKPAEDGPLLDLYNKQRERQAVLIKTTLVQIADLKKKEEELGVVLTEAQRATINRVLGLEVQAEATSDLVEVEEVATKSKKEDTKEIDRQAAAIEKLREEMLKINGEIQRQKDAAGFSTIFDPTIPDTAKRSVEDLDDAIGNIAPIDDEGLNFWEKIGLDPESTQNAVDFALSSVQFLLDSIGMLQQAGTNRELAELEATEKKKLELAEGNAEKEAAIRAQFEQEREKIEEDAAKKAQTLAIFQALINTAVGITKAFATLPPPFNFIQAGVIGAAGAAQVAFIQSQKFADGGWVEGGTKGKDSVHAMLMPDEFVLKPGPAREFADILPLINEGKLTRDMIAPGIATPIIAFDARRIEGAIGRASREHVAVAEKQLRELKRFNNRGRMPGTNL